MLSSGSRLGGIAGVLIAAILWGTTGTAATYAPGLSPLAVGAVAMGIGGLLQGLIAAATIVSQRVLISQNWHFLLTGAVAVAIYPLAFMPPCITSVLLSARLFPSVLHQSCPP